MPANGFVKALMTAAKKNAGLTSDYALSVALRVSRQRVSHWKAGRQFPSPACIRALAELAGTDPGEALVEYTHAKERHRKRVRRPTAKNGLAGRKPRR